MGSWEGRDETDLRIRKKGEKRNLRSERGKQGEERAQREPSTKGSARRFMKVNKLGDVFYERCEGEEKPERDEQSRESTPCLT
jgi:hypothetical protein